MMLRYKVYYDSPTELALQHQITQTASAAMTTIENQFDDQLNLTAPSYDVQYILARTFGEPTKDICNYQITLLMKCVLLGRKCPHLFDTYLETKEVLNEIDSDSSDGYTPLMIAAMNSAGVSTVYIVRKLIEKNAKINGLYSIEYGESALHCAILRAANTASIDAIRLLLENGADTQANSFYELTPLELAIHFLEQGSTPAVVKVLIPFSELNQVNLASTLTPLECILRTFLGKIKNRNDMDNLDKQITESLKPPQDTMIDVMECLILAGATFNAQSHVGAYLFRIYSRIVQSLLQRQQEQLAYRASFNQMVKDNEIGLENLIRDYI